MHPFTLRAALRAVAFNACMHAPQELAALARRRRVCLHVDACLGGFYLPFARALGGRVPPFDFSVPGVTSISVDTHKCAPARMHTCATAAHAGAPLPERGAERVLAPCAEHAFHPQACLCFACKGAYSFVFARRVSEHSEHAMLMDGGFKPKPSCMSPSVLFLLPALIDTRRAHMASHSSHSLCMRACQLGCRL